MSTPDIPALARLPFGDDSPCDAAACARDRIFQAARTLFHRYGIRGVSVDAIAAEAGTTKVTLYRVFASKDDLIVQVLKDHSRRFWQWWDAILAQHPQKPHEQIEALFRGLREEISCDDAERGCPVANAAVEVVDENHPAYAVIREHTAEVGRRLRELCAEMNAKEPEVLGDALTLLFSGVFSARLIHGGRDQIANVCDAVTALLDSPLGVARRGAKTSRT